MKNKSRIVSIRMSTADFDIIRKKAKDMNSNVSRFLTKSALSFDISTVDPKLSSAHQTKQSYPK